MKTPNKIDLYKIHKADYAAATQPALVKINEATYLAITGQGAPGGELFSDCVAALYGVAYTIKMKQKKDGKADYAVCKLEGQWWVDGPACDWSRIPKDKWHWKLLIRTPRTVTAGELKTAVATLLEKRKTQAVGNVTLEAITEGPCVQMLHVGPYERERESIMLMKTFAESQGLQFHGLHHEIYLSDPRRMAPEKLKTILRMPVQKNGAPKVSAVLTD